MATLLMSDLILFIALIVLKHSASCAQLNNISLFKMFHKVFDDIHGDIIQNQQYTTIHLGSIIYTHQTQCAVGGPDLIH
jgi:hypothetical protein